MDQNQTHQQNNLRMPPLATGDMVARQLQPPVQACPRCSSTNTKFCYYNNYSLSQPRYFCKGCRRYWTHGGTLRNVPVGGGCRKSKRPKLSPASTTTADKNPVPPAATGGNDPVAPALSMAPTINNPPKFYGGGGGGFLSSLVAIQAGAQPLGFGSNLGLFHGLGFPGFDNQLQPQPQQQPQQQNPEFSFQELLQHRANNNSGGASSSTNWNLSNDDKSHWTHFPSSSGLGGP